MKNGLNVSNYTHVHNIVSTGDKTYYDILFIACSSLFNRFTLYLDGLTLKLADHTSQGTFAMGQNIRSSSFEQDISNIVTKILIVDDNGKPIKPVVNQKLIDQYGVFQEIYNYKKT